MDNFYDPPYNEINFAKFGRLIKDKREKIGLTQTDLAKLVGVSVSLVSQWENNERSVTFSKLITVMNVLNINVSYLITPQFDIYCSNTLHEEPTPYDEVTDDMVIDEQPLAHNKIKYKDAIIHRINQMDNAELEALMNVADSLIKLRAAKG